jgi:hypothetical protein
MLEMKVIVFHPVGGMREEAHRRDRDADCRRYLQIEHRAPQLRLTLNTDA